MKKFRQKSMVLVIVLALLMSSLSMNIFAADKAQPISPLSMVNSDQGQIIVAYETGTSEDNKKAIREMVKAQKKSSIKLINADVLKVNNPDAAIINLKKHPEVKFAEIDSTVKAYLIPDDPAYPSQTGLALVNASSAWEHTTGSPEVKVAILDTGINSSNPDFANRISGGCNIIADSLNYMDDNGHGTAVASILAAAINNGYLMAGIAGKCSILPVKVLDASGNGSYSDIISGIDYAVANGAKVISMSLGGPDYLEVMQLAVNNAVSSGVTIVAAAGNESATKISYPAACSGVIAVGAVDSNMARASYSNTGTGLTVMAPGTSIVETIKGRTSTSSGTSIATPFVSGLAALMYSVQSAVTPAQVKYFITKNAKDLGSAGYDIQYGYGLIDIGATIHDLISSYAPPVDTTPPVITLIGEPSVTVRKGTAYSDPGATAYDNTDGDITNRIVMYGIVDTGTAGVYTISFNVIDSAGNKAATVTRTVNVTEPEPIVLTGSLTRTVTSQTHTVNVTASGKLTMIISYSGKKTPFVTITGTNQNNTGMYGTTGEYMVVPGTYTIKVSSSSPLAYTLKVIVP